MSKVQPLHDHCLGEYVKRVDCEFFFFCGVKTDLPPTGPLNRLISCIASVSLLDSHTANVRQGIDRNNR